MNLLLTSSGFSSISIRERFCSEIKNNNLKTLAVIPTAEQDYSDRREEAIESEVYFNAFGLKKVCIIDVEFMNIDDLRKTDIIYLDGGNPYYLLYQLRKSKADELFREIKEKTLFVGSSAGSIVLGSTLDFVSHINPRLNTMDLIDLTGIGLYNFILFAHYKGLIHDEKVSDEMLSSYEKESNLKIIKISDNQAIHIKNGKQEII
jgi:dipeptidase E